MDFSFLANLHPLAQVITAIALVFGAIGGGIYLTRRAIGDAAATPAPAAPKPQFEFFVDGPIKVFLDNLGRIVEAVEKIPASADELQEIREKVAEAIRDTRHTLRTEMQRENAHFEQELEKIENRINEILGRLEKRVHDVEMKVARMEGGGQRR